MATYTPVLTYTFRDTLATSDPAKIIKGAYLDGEFSAIHTASLDAMSLSGPNAVVGSNTWTGTNSFNNNITVSPASGTAVVINAASGAAALALGANAGQSSVLSFSHNAGAKQYSLGGITNDTDFQIYDITASAVRLGVNTVGGVTVNTPSSGTTLTINAANSAQGLSISDGTIALNQSTDASHNHFLLTSGGTSLNLGTNNVNRLSIAGGGASIAGYGPVAAALVDMTPDKGTWVGALTGAVSTTGTFHWSRQGSQVCIWLEANVQATSGSANTIAVSGLPSAIQPSVGRIVPCASILNNGQGDLLGIVQVNTGAGTLSVGVCSSITQGLQFSVFAGSGTTGLQSGWSITYSL